MLTTNFSRIDLRDSAALQRQFVVVLAGVLEIEAGDGETRRFGPGSVVLVTDLTGPGHRTRVRGPDEAALLWVPVP